ncbi:hypothetical protein [Dactylosporangium sp. NPDC048998]|uniref:hypothetical protein n=1 Tax=Dactylosporangium sp. NPDC048998 TaxID=3363976 RepID=UPI0037195F49
MRDRVVRHWWNNAWGRLNRRDVFIRTDGETFELELRLGGADSRPPWRRFPTLDVALEEAANRMAADQRWSDITGAHTRRT